MKGKSNIPTTQERYNQKQQIETESKKELCICWTVQGCNQSFSAKPNWNMGEARMRCLDLFSLGCEHGPLEEEGGMRKRTRTIMVF